MDVMARAPGSRFTADSGNDGLASMCRIRSRASTSVEPQSSQVTPFASVALAGRSSGVEMT